MFQKLKIKKGDNLIVITGKDKGKTGEVIEILRSENKVKIRGINIVKKHRKPTQNTPGGIDQIESFINVSNVALIDPKDNKATRVKYLIDKKGNKSRIAVRSGMEIK
tara:strand:+ start:1264 stop:1584 length:321 start_codon:yes stop_codon:yes gene_type:complete